MEDKVEKKKGRRVTKNSSGLTTRSVETSLEKALRKSQKEQRRQERKKAKEDKTIYNKYKKLSEEDKETLDLYRKSFNAATQTLINYYDSACSKYVDGKVDKVRFKKSYKNEIRKLIENKDLKEYFDPLTSSYKPILNVYAEWEKLE